MVHCGSVSINFIKFKHGEYIALRAGKHVIVIIIVNSTVVICLLVMVCSSKSNFTIHTAIRVTESIKKREWVFHRSNRLQRGFAQCCAMLCSHHNSGNRFKENKKKKKLVACSDAGVNA